MTIATEREGRALSLSIVGDAVAGVVIAIATVGIVIVSQIVRSVEMTRESRRPREVSPTSHA